MRELLLLLPLLLLCGCTTQSVVITVHPGHDWPWCGDYVVPLDRYEALVAEFTHPCTNHVSTADWDDQPVLTVKHCGRSLDMFEPRGWRGVDLSFLSKRGERMLFVGGQCILGGELDTPLHPQQTGSTQHQPAPYPEPRKGAAQER